MKSQDIINSWKEQRGHVEVGQNFTEKVMNQICQYEQKKRKPLFDVQWFVELISAHPLVKTGLIATGAVVGLVRLIFMIVVILSKGVING